MRLNEIEEFLEPTENLGVYESNKVWVLPIRVLGTLKITSEVKPCLAWIELDKGTHVIADAATDIAFKSLGPNEWLAMVEAFGTVVISGLPSLSAAEDVLKLMTPLLWTDAGCGFLEKPKLEVCGSVTTVDIDNGHILKLVRNYATGRFDDVAGYVRVDR